MGWEGRKGRGDERRRNVIGSDCVCVWFLLVQPREEQGLGVGEEKDEESVLVLYNGCDEKRELLPSTDVLFISRQYSIVIAVDLTPSMLQVVSLQLFCYITILSHLLPIFCLFYSVLLVLQSNQTFQVKLDTAVYSLCMCLQHLAQPVSVCWQQL